MTINLDDAPRGGTMCFDKAGLVISSTPANYGVVSAQGAGVVYCINGIFYYVADTVDQAMTAATAQGLLTTCIYLVCGTTSSTFVTVKGTPVLNADLAAGTAVCQYPEPAVDTCPLGAIIVTTLTSGNFTAGTTALTPAATLSVVYQDFCCIPSHPYIP